MVGSIAKELSDSKKTIHRYKMVVAFLVLGLVFCVFKLSK